MSNSHLTEEDIELRDQIRANAPPKRIRKKHLVLGFKFDFSWAREKAIPLYGEVDLEDYTSAAFHDHVSKYRFHCMRKSGIARYLRLRVADVKGLDGEKEHVTIIGITENRGKNRFKLPPPTGIKKLMRLLETEEAPEWYVVSADSY